MDLTLELTGVDELVKANATYARRLPGVVLNAIRRPLRRTVTKVRQRIRRESGIGKSIWGARGKAGGLERVVRMISAKASGASIHTGIRLTGLPVLIEEGGQIKPHLIKKAWGRAIAKHPGGPVRAHFFARSEMAHVTAPILQAIRADLDKLKAKVFSQAA